MKYFTRCNIKCGLIDIKIYGDGFNKLNRVLLKFIFNERKIALILTFKNT